MPVPWKPILLIIGQVLPLLPWNRGEKKRLQEQQALHRSEVESLRSEIDALNQRLHKCQQYFIVAVAALVLVVACAALVLILKT